MSYQILKKNKLKKQYNKLLSYGHIQRLYNYNKIYQNHPSHYKHHHCVLSNSYDFTINEHITMSYK